MPLNGSPAASSGHGTAEPLTNPLLSPFRAWEARSRGLASDIPAAARDCPGRIVLLEEAIVRLEAMDIRLADLSRHAMLAHRKLDPMGGFAAVRRLGLLFSGLRV